MCSFVVAGLARLPLIGVPSDGRGVVVDLTGDSDDEVTHESPVRSAVIVENVETMVSSPMRIVVEDVGSLERDGVGGPTRGGEVAPATVSYSIPPPLHRHSSSDDDDVILVSCYNPTQASSDVRPESKVSTPLTHHLNHIITCPICLETQKNFSLIGHCLVTTKCGHLFCDNCLKKSISLTHKCPTCSSKLTLRQYHRIYV